MKVGTLVKARENTTIEMEGPHGLPGDNSHTIHTVEVDTGCRIMVVLVPTLENIQSRPKVEYNLFNPAGITAGLIGEVVDIICDSVKVRFDRLGELWLHNSVLTEVTDDMFAPAV